MEHIEWLLKRQQYITATESIYCLQNFSLNEELVKKYKAVDGFKKKPLEFFLYKKFNKDQLMVYNTLNDNKYKKMGRELEDDVAATYKKYFPNEKDQIVDFQKNGLEMFFNEEYKLSATPDYFITRESGKKELLECKTTSMDVNEKEKLIVRYEVQCQQQLLCTGLDVCNLCICFLNKNGKIYTVHNEVIRKNEDLQKEIITCAIKCQKWLQDTKIEDFDLTKMTKDLKLIYNIYTNNLSSYIDTYINNKSIASEFKDAEEVVKAVCNNNIQVDNYNFVTQTREPSYLTIEKAYQLIDDYNKKIEDLKEKIAQMEKDPDLKLIHTAGYVIIKDIIKYDSNN